VATAATAAGLLVADAALPGAAIRNDGHSAVMTGRYKSEGAGVSPAGSGGVSGQLDLKDLSQVGSLAGDRAIVPASSHPRGIGETASRLEPVDGAAGIERRLERSAAGDEGASGRED